MTQLAVAVSGGVDSLCALLRLREQGHDVLALHGLFLPDAASSGLRPAPEGPRLLTAAEALAAPLPPASRQAVEGLQTACGQLGIPLHVADMRAVFDREVVTPFVRAYARGRTPNPCALCNRAIKFGALLDAALSLGADRIATGHYARLLDGPAGPVLAAADDLAKDQSYFLSLVPLERLRRAVFPLARQDKAASIAQVKDAGLAVPVPQESQEICFIPAGEDAYRAFLERRWQAEGLSLPGSGPVLLEEADSDGRPVLRPLARHEGLWRYTEGQRRGLGIAHSEPLYVLRKQGEDNTLVVGGRARLGMRGCLTGPANLLCPPEQWPDTLLARLRHRQRPTPARVEITDGGLRITLAEPQFPSAPGQVAAIYDEQGRVLAGALVREVRPTALICVDSLCSSEPQRLGRTLQFSDTGLCPAQPGSSKHLDAARLGLPVIAAGIPTLMMAQEGKDLVVTPRELDSVIAHGAALLGAAINRALQPRLSIAQLCWLVG